MNYTLKKQIHHLLNENRVDTFIVTHKYADIDAVASALSLREYIEKHYSKLQVVGIVFPEGISREAREVYRKLTGKNIFNTQNITDKLPDKKGVFILVDAASIQQVPGLERILQKEKRILIIDHHKDNRLKKKIPFSYIDSHSTSTSEIISRLFNKKELSRENACLLTAGILVDSSRLYRATSKTFRELSKLTSVCTYQEVVKALSKEKEDRALKLARLKALQRMIIKEKDELIIGITHVGSYESDIASSLLKNGVNIAIVLSPKRNETRIIIRMKPDVPNETKQEIIEAIRQKLDAEGGGHAEATVLVINKKIEKREIPSYCKRISLIIEEYMNEMEI